MGFAIQAGAFSNVENASRLSEFLRGQGLDAYYFVFGTGLYKVRFGNYSTEADARKKAEDLKSSGVIDEYYIIKPTDYAAAHLKDYGSDYLRKEILRTARSFIGVPYLWGGSSFDEGFDCSGLTMTVYRLNGLNLPRSSVEQYEYGVSIEKNQLRIGDLVFFKIEGRGKISHVGIYAGGQKFIHAPGRGRKICTEILSSRYFSKRYAGARRYFS